MARDFSLGSRNNGEDGCASCPDPGLQVDPVAGEWGGRGRPSQSSWMWGGLAAPERHRRYLLSGRLPGRSTGALSHLPDISGLWASGGLVTGPHCCGVRSRMFENCTNSFSHKDDDVTGGAKAPGGPRPPAEPRDGAGGSKRDEHRPERHCGVSSGSCPRT